MVNESPSGGDAAFEKIRNKEASPTISLAVEQGGEMLDALRARVRDMTPSQRQIFRNGLSRFEAALNDRMSELEEIEDAWYKIAAPIFGILLGGSAELASGAGGLTVAGWLSGLTAESALSRLDRKKRQVLMHRIARCRRLLDEVEQVG